MPGATAVGVELTESARTARQLHELAVELKKVADRDLRLALNREIRRVTLPVKAAVRASALTELPRRGGLAQRVASSKISSRTTTSARQAGVRLRVEGTLDIEGLNATGRLRHPVHAHGDRSTWTWVEQKTKAGFLDRAVAPLLPETQIAIGRALAQIKTRVEAI